MIVDIVVVKIFVVNCIDRLTTAHIIIDYTSIKNIIVVNTQIVDNVIDIEIVDIVIVDISKSNRNENWRWRKIVKRCWIQFVTIVQFV